MGTTKKIANPSRATFGRFVMVQGENERASRNTKIGARGKPRSLSGDLVERRSLSFCVAPICERSGPAQWGWESASGGEVELARQLSDRLRQPRPAHGIGRGPRPLPLLRDTNRIGNASCDGLDPGQTRTSARYNQPIDPCIASPVERDLLSEPWRIRQDHGEEALTQALGRVVKVAGLEAMLVLSAAKKDAVNLIIFPDNLSSQSRLHIINVEQLPAKREL